MLVDSLGPLFLLFAGLICEQVGVSADGFRKDLIKLAGDTELVLLKLWETADHESVLEVRSNHVLQEFHVVCAELAETLVHQATQFTIAVSTIILKSVIKIPKNEVSERATAD